MAQPTENSQLTASSRRPRTWARNSRVQPAVSARIRIGLLWRCWSGTCASAASRTVMWSAAVLLPAFPRRSIAARNSPVLSQNASIGWNPKLFLFSALDDDLSDGRSGLAQPRSGRCIGGRDGAPSDLREAGHSQRCVGRLGRDLVELSELVAGAGEADL